MLNGRFSERVTPKLISLVAFLISSSAADATSLKDFWSTRPPDDPHFESKKSSLALEECIALELSEKLGVPNVIHGERETLVTAMIQGPFSQAPQGGARIVDRGASREVFVGALHTGGMRDKLSALVQSCI
jgi:hypothetical protein